MLTIHKKPLRWDDAAARLDPESLPFWRFYVEVQQAREQPRFADRASRWLRGLDDVDAGRVSIPPA